MAELAMPMPGMAQCELSGPAVSGPDFGSQGYIPNDVACYPPAAATHEDVIADKHVFERTLNQLLHRLGIPYKVPKIGGAEIDLHRLYCEVTKYGGVEQVIARKMFVTVCEPFNFPASFTNKSFVMRKLYNNMLHHYEQVYYHRNTGPLVPPPASEHQQAGRGTRINSPARSKSSSKTAKAARLPASGQITLGVKPFAACGAAASPGSKRKQSDRCDDDFAAQVTQTYSAAAAALMGAPFMQPMAALGGYKPGSAMQPAGMVMPPGVTMPGGEYDTCVSYRDPSNAGTDLSHGSARSGVVLHLSTSTAGTAEPQPLAPPGLTVGTAIQTHITGVYDTHYAIELVVPGMAQPVRGQLYKSGGGGAQGGAVLGGFGYPGSSAMHYPAGAMPGRCGGVAPRRVSNSMYHIPGSRLSSHMHVQFPGGDLSTAGAHMPGPRPRMRSSMGGLPTVTGGGEVDDHLSTLDTGFTHTLTDELGYGFDDMGRGWGVDTHVGRGPSCGGMVPLDLSLPMNDAAGGVDAAGGAGAARGSPGDADGAPAKRARLQAHDPTNPHGHPATTKGPGHTNNLHPHDNTVAGARHSLPGDGPSAYKLFTDELLRRSGSALVCEADGRLLLAGRPLQEAAAEQWEKMSPEEKAPYQQQAMQRLSFTSGPNSWVLHPAPNVRTTVGSHGGMMDGVPAHVGPVREGTSASEVTLLHNPTPLGHSAPQLPGDLTAVTGGVAAQLAHPATAAGDATAGRTPAGASSGGAADPAAAGGARASPRGDASAAQALVSPLYHGGAMGGVLNLCTPSQPQLFLGPGNHLMASTQGVGLNMPYNPLQGDAAGNRPVYGSLGTTGAYGATRQQGTTAGFTGAHTTARGVLPGLATPGQYLSMGASPLEAPSSLMLQTALGALTQATCDSADAAAALDAAAGAKHKGGYAPHAWGLGGGHGDAGVAAMLQPACAGRRTRSIGGVGEDDDAMLHVMPLHPSTDGLMFTGMEGSGGGGMPQYTGGLLLRRQPAGLMARNLPSAAAMGYQAPADAHAHVTAGGDCAAAIATGATGDAAAAAK